MGSRRFNQGDYQERGAAKWDQGNCNGWEVGGVCYSIGSDTVEKAKKRAIVINRS